MVITQKFNWNRIDFSYTAKCENPECGKETTCTSGYDDDNYYQNVVPNQKCPHCKKSTNDMKLPIAPGELKYDPNRII
jgi:hypothetical protein